MPDKFTPITLDTNTVQGYIILVQLKLIDTYWPLIIPAITTPVVVFVMYFLLSRYIVEGVSLGSVKG